jgi:CubicO group peptidase (beta-lactamase class C family)
MSSNRDAVTGGDDSRGDPAGGRLTPGVVHVVAAATVGVLVALLGIWFMPRVPSLSTQLTGDRDLVAKSRPHLAGALDVVSVAAVDDATISYAGLGADENTVYEIGSITKTFTSALLADAISRGEVTAQTHLGDLLPVRGTPVADVTLAELASHRSGLPRVGTRPTIRENLLLLTHRSAFTADLDDLLRVARSARLTNRGRYMYSDLGFALLGEGLASAAHTDYPRLLHQRLLGPLGMTSTTVPTTGSDLRADASAGYSADGQHQKPWAMHAWVSAGGIRSTAADMAKYAAALLDGSAPGMDALDPRWVGGNGAQVGYAWNIEELEGKSVTHHGGATGGFCAAIALDRTNQRAVIVLSNTKVPVENAARSVLVGMS